MGNVIVQEVNRRLILKNAGDLDGALSDFKAGSEFGSRKALNHIEQLQKSLDAQPQWIENLRDVTIICKQS